MNLEILGTAVALGETEAVALYRTVFSSGTEENFIDGEGGDLRPGGLVNNPRGAIPKEKDECVCFLYLNRSIKTLLENQIRLFLLYLGRVTAT